ncbi:MAG: hypothetical protein NEA02_05515 [Thermoanaerobaculia bacterium]|nr:hypothetical protein [Thermoanaerobaculia bacterium]
MQKGHFRLFAVLGGGVVLALSVAGFLLVEGKPLDTTWTPAHLALPLATTADRLQVLVGDIPLEKAIAERRLTLARDAGPLVVLEATVRMNNAPQLREARLMPLLALSAIAGGALVLFVIGLFAPRIGALHQNDLIDLHLTT